MPAIQKLLASKKFVLSVTALIAYALIQAVGGVFSVTDMKNATLALTVLNVTFWGVVDAATALRAAPQNVNVLIKDAITSAINAIMNVDEPVPPAPTQTVVSSKLPTAQG